ncbi:cytidylate kinase Cmk [Peptoclostridium acidaminophilum DSM 3953]|uniref:Cytidylate kinase n=1 Tax=Peptoclostridium acidaminophilum DSM 3953 TaxID=1286171 RepID=W8TKH3_PEPAC|nr:(d)CMP kinase [Peptoclostridium acidaminophilum]AHM56672.1 cytidylate kinase Cmk [Peptoclostridium acidaminophilum DSM 3953]
MNTHIVIAIDGPAGSGKSTVAKLIAKKLGIVYIDTGAMYRALAYKAYTMDISFEDEKSIAKLAEAIEIELEGEKVLLDGIRVDGHIRMPVINENVSKVAKIRQVRDIMVMHQREMGKKRSVVMDGRDIGTHVFPNASYKFFLVADIDERARRRSLELIQKGYEVEFGEIKAELENRDMQDSTREASPLIKASDALEIDTTSKTPEEVADTIIRLVRTEE